VFARHYLRNHYCFLLLWVLRCFSSPRSPPIAGISRSAPGWVAPFGHLRIKGYLHLPEAFRSLSRPSSPLRAKASTIRSYVISVVSYSYSIIIFTGNPLMTFLPKAKSQNRLPALIVFSYVYLPSMSKIVVASLKAGGYRLLAYGSWHFLNANSQRPITNSQFCKEQGSRTASTGRGMNMSSMPPGILFWLLIIDSWRFYCQQPTANSQWLI
jgi:hypothetical protein